VERAGQRLSTLDLVQPDRFTLLIDSHGDAWEQASRHLGVPIEVVRFGADVVDLDGWWTSVARMSPGGALLVRPDQHVAFRSTGALGEARRTLREAVARILGTSR
jgi:2,4-dichlorophenol 6-monooxygenase